MQEKLPKLCLLLIVNIKLNITEIKTNFLK